MGSGNLDRQDTHHNAPSHAPSLPERRLSGRAYQALRQHAGMYRALGMRVAGEDTAEIILADNRLTLRLGYRVHRKLLARIYHLQARMAIVASTTDPTPGYRLDLRARELAVAGPGADKGRDAADRLGISELVRELEERVDLESFSLAWSPDSGSYLVTLEPYPGSHISMLLPPMAYTVKLKEPEVEAIYCFLYTLAGLLYPTLSPSRDGEEEAN